jgi:hypothetical protein
VQAQFLQRREGEFRRQSQLQDGGNIMKSLNAHVNANMHAENHRAVHLKIIQTGVSPEKLNDEFVELSLTCQSIIFWPIVCGIDVNESGGGVRYGCASPTG